MSLAVVLEKELRRIVKRELGPMTTRLRNAEQRIAELGRRADQPRTPEVSPKPSPGPRGRKLKLSPARRAALRLHGRYLGALRALAPRQKAAVKATRASKGVEAAIRLAKRLARS